MKDIHTGKLLSASMKMAELPDIDSGLLGVMRRLGIRFGFGERTVSVNANETSGDSEELSAREKEILVCVAKGMLNKEIADHYNISIYTVITHRKHITRKTGIKTVAGLTVYALLNNLIDMNSME